MRTITVELLARIPEHASTVYSRTPRKGSMNIKSTENGDNFFTLLIVIMLMMLKIVCPLIIFYALRHPAGGRRADGRRA